MAFQQIERFKYRRPPELDDKLTTPIPVAVIGAGPVGLSAAIDLVQHGVPVMLLDEDDTLSPGSRAICWAKRTLEIFDRLGVGERIVEKGITWNIGKVFHHDKLLYSFKLLAETSHKMPAFVNLQQYYVEKYLVDRALEVGVDLRWCNRVVGAWQDSEGVTLRVETPDGSYDLNADYVLAADGAHSPTRKMLGLSFEGKVFEDRFLIADVRMEADFPAERWFWFDPPFHFGQSALLHRQADDIWRIDLQLGWDADPEEERKPERVVPRLKAMLGDSVSFELDWVSVYTFQCRRLKSFRRERIIFIGDSAHQVSPFGARGGNSGIQDADNLSWKLALVLQGTASESLLDSYDEERILATDENIREATRTTDFMTPKGHGSKLLRDAALQLALHHGFARSLVNSGRLSMPTVMKGCALQTADIDQFEGGPIPGAPCIDAPVSLRSGEASWLLNHLGHDFCILVFGDQWNCIVPELTRTLREAEMANLSLRPVLICNGPGVEGMPILGDVHGFAGPRYDAQPGTVYLIRPDQHVAARWRRLQADSVLASLSRAAGAKIAPAHLGS